MEVTDDYIEAVREAINEEDVSSVVDLIEGADLPFWLRRGGLELVSACPNDEFSMAVFNRLFLPVQKAINGDVPLLLEWWILRDERIYLVPRFFYIQKFINEAVACSDLPDGLYNALLGIFANWTGQSKSIAGWSATNTITRLFLSTYQRITPARILDARLFRAALWSGDLGLMRSFAEIGVRAAEAPDHRMMVTYLVSLLLEFSDKTSLRSLAEKIYVWDPHHPIAINNLAQLYVHERRDVDSIVQLYRGIDPERDPENFKSAIKWIIMLCYDRGYKSEATALFEMLPSSADSVQLELGWRLKGLQSDAGAMTDVLETHVPLIEMDGLPPLIAQPIGRVLGLIQGDMTWESVLTPKDITHHFDVIVEHIGTIPRNARLLGASEQVAQQMIMLARRYFEPSRHFEFVPRAQKYGRIDIGRLQSAYIGLHRVAAEVALIGLEAILNGAHLRAMEQCLILLRYYVNACLASGEAHKALELLSRFEGEVAVDEFVRRMKELCYLELGDTKRLAKLLSPTELKRSRVYEIVDRDQWSLAERLTWEIIVDDAQIEGQFDITWPDGRLITYDHVVPSAQIAIARHDRLTLRRGEILVGGKNKILRAPRVDYPDGMPEIVARGARAVRFLRLGPPNEISEATVIFEDFHAIFHRNYYHWIVPLLTRINYIKKLGLLEGRRLVVPEGLTRWMLDTCSAIGVNEENLLVAPNNVDLYLTNVTLISMDDDPSRTLIKDFVEKILPPSAIEHASEEPLYLYLSRRDQTRRPFRNEQEIEAIARGLGFVILQPERLTFIEQARIFRRATAVAGPAGAAFSNMMFCQPGTRILTLLNENDLAPEFNNLATVMELRFRNLTGKAELDDHGINFLWAPYSIDPQLAERDLKWAIGRAAN